MLVRSARKVSQGLSYCAQSVHVNFSQNPGSEVLDLGNAVCLYQPKFSLDSFRNRTAALKQVILVHVEKVRQRPQQFRIPTVVRRAGEQPMPPGFREVDSLLHKALANIFVGKTARVFGVNDIQEKLEFRGKNLFIASRIYGVVI
jgi:hypothetical protein